ncbi:MAG: hypothetical protein RI929_288 [Actinomycetota bacterium]|jgi:dTDP-4-dehydrorhamnose reductase
MLGQQVSKTAIESGLNVLQISRSTNPLCNFPKQQFEDLSESIDLGPEDWLVNCVGWIPQKSTLNEQRDAAAAFALNAFLPEAISRARNQSGFNWVQIATDCVFSGLRGEYKEDDNKDAQDLYGQTKIAGEEKSNGAIQIRCSIVGPDLRSSAGLFSWFQAESKKGPLPGFVDHLWNGVTTKIFAKLVVGMVESKFVETGSWHWAPRDEVSKFELLTCFAQKLALPKTIVYPQQSKDPRNRTLSTLYESQSSFFWNLAGYATPPSVAEMVEDMDVYRGGML